VYSKILKGLNTPAAIITDWAPPANNPTATYIANVSNWTGIGANTILDENFYNNQVNGITGFVAAITRQEGNPVDQNNLVLGYNDFINDYNP
jgi:hypothetical protein